MAKIGQRSKGFKSIVQGSEVILPSGNGVGPALPLDTLAQHRNSPSPGGGRGVREDPAEIQARHVRRARSKAMAEPLFTALAELRSSLEQSYRNSIYCAGAFEQVEDKLTTKYCKNRWCPVCNRIRMAQQIEAYRPIIEAWPGAQFVTLTCRTVPGDELAGAYQARLDAFKRIKDSMRKAGVVLVCLRKIECTYNVEDDRYHLHIHAIVQTEEQALRLVAGWLKQFPGEASPRAQDVRPCDEGSLVELLKYSTKLVVKGKDAAGRYVPAFALDVIFRALHKKRLVQPVGFKVPKKVLDLDAGDFEVEGGIPALTRLGESVLWEWERELHDWIDKATGEALSGYQPTEDELRLIEGEGLRPEGDRVSEGRTEREADVVAEGDPPALSSYVPPA